MGSIFDWTHEEISRQSLVPQRGVLWPFRWRLDGTLIDLPDEERCAQERPGWSRCCLPLGHAGAHCAQELEASHA